ncbi:MAG TPA: carboxypeptidase-like regulatory domain-containing protein, partial [Puia sp.]|nr:carboxypeptidase-like regulatory domain-containing protein [Puia sp.]
MIQAHKLLPLALVLLFLQQLVLAQTVPVTGTVKDDKGSPVVGATITVKGTATAAQTDANGKYNIKAPPQATLTISAIGYGTLEEKINGRTAIDVTLQEKAAELNNVVVVGYGTQKKADLTGAIATVSGGDLNKRVATDPTQLLQGKLPGLSLTQSSGEAGNEGLTLRVRGLGTNSSAGSSPLVIVDGLPGSLSNLDPQN